MDILTKNTRIYIILGGILVLLLIPLIAMQFTEEVSWSAFDFLVMGILLTCVGLAIEFTIRKTSNSDRRILLIVAIVVIFLLTWAELAVGVFGTPFAGS